MSTVNDNPFLKVLRQSHEQNWCMKLWCTTCGAMRYRQALKEIGDGPDGLLNALVTADLGELASFPQWEDAIQVAVRDLPIPGQASVLLGHWLDPAQRDIRTFDILLYRLVRLLPRRDGIRLAWIEKGIGLALKTKDFSLTESLMLTVRDEAIRYPELVSLAREIAEGSNQMRRVFRNACGVEFDASAGTTPS